MKNLISWQKQSGETIQVQGWTLTPQSQVLQVRLPIGGFVWHRPLCVVVEGNGDSQTIPITDVTRQALWVILGLSILVSLLFSRKR